MPRSLNALYGKHGKNLMKTDVRETEDTYELDIDLPGFKKDEVNLELKDGYLTIQAAKGLDKEEPEKKGKYIRQERYAGACSRSFYVGEHVEPPMPPPMATQMKIVVSAEDAPTAASAASPL